MSRLHIYTVHVNPSLALPYEKAQFVEEGFSWPAFVFTFLWGLYHGLWLQAALIFIADMFFMFMSNHHNLTLGGYVILHGGVRLIAGFFGNDWRRAKLARGGYITADLVTGDSELAAELRFFDRYFASHTQAV